MGSVTYRILCLTKTLVLAVPPQFIEAIAADEQSPTAMESSPSV
jgi:hypothetical protein